MMQRAASPAVEPNVTITDFTGNGTNSVTVDLGISSPTILVFYPKQPLVDGTFPNSTTDRLMMIGDSAFNRDFYANTRSGAASGGYLSMASSARAVYSNGNLSFNSSSIVFRNAYAYRCVAIKQAASNVTITDFTGNGQTSITLNIGINNPSYLILYATAPLSSGSFPNASSQRLLGISDPSLNSTSQFYANSRTNTSYGSYFEKSSSKQLYYENGILTVSASSVLRNNYAYRVIAIA